ncbi:MAG: hypothetical protein U1E70_24135 [Acetobacteraceae bacterium]|nr:hypothetical protein [Pseudomonadota bacterium]
MADHSTTQAADSEGLQALTEDRMRMWTGFTNATLYALIFVVVLLIGMAFFLL